MADARRTRHEAPARREPGDDELVATLIELGASREAAEEAVRRGDPQGAVFDSVLLSGRLERTVSPADIEAQGGLSAEDVVEMMESFGLPPADPAEATFTPDEARVYTELRRLIDIWPRELRLQMGRVYGRALARIARAEVQAFQLQAAPRLRARADDVIAELHEVQSAFQRLLPLADPLLVGVHRRLLEHELAQAAVSDAQARVGDSALPGAVEVAFLFCDLKDFTSYAEREGDAAAIVAIDLFFDTVGRERGERGRIVKSLGDGAMLAYPASPHAVAAGARIIGAMRSTEVPGVHASVHSGVAIAREGDYFGSSVNLAARLLAVGGRDELIATYTVVEECGDEFAWEPLGERRIRGMGSAVDLHRLLEPS